MRDIYFFPTTACQQPLVDFFPKLRACQDLRQAIEPIEPERGLAICIVARGAELVVSVCNPPTLRSVEDDKFGSHRSRPVRRREVQVYVFLGIAPERW
jgi:hypothetical protein